MLVTLYFVVALSCAFLFVPFTRLPRTDWVSVWVS